ncbi:hypothetical protein SAMN05443247_10543 [Bradyrhizobium erythrophlei]|jgi:hypothetical protein|nr:hypothetical protein SAMN05443247_10543 [Bradyrhizobium erythrophlei]
MNVAKVRNPMPTLMQPEKQFVMMDVSVNAGHAAESPEVRAGLGYIRQTGRNARKRRNAKRVNSTRSSSRRPRLRARGDA